MASSQTVELVRGSAQELVKELKLAVPERYVQEYQEPAFVYDGSSSSLPSIPVVDMNHLLMGESNIDLQLENLRCVCKEWGIFQLVNHGVSRSLVEKMKKEIEGFFSLPLEEKLRYELRPGEVEGYGQTILHNQDQKVDWADCFYMITNPLHRRKSHLLPQLPSSLRETMETYLKELQKLCMSLLELIGQAVNINKKEMVEIFENGMQSVRMTYYPPCPQPDKVIGLTPHSDAAGITILLQVNEVEGLQVKKDGVWIPVNFLPNALVVNVGDVLECEELKTTHIWRENKL